MSLKNFFSPPKKFGDNSFPSLPNDPFDAARLAWDRRDGEVRVQNYNYRRIIFLLLISVILLICGLVYQSSKSSVAPYVIEVDSSTGMAKNVGMVQSQEYKPKEAEIKYFLGEFIKDTRGIPLDPVVFSQNWNKAYAYMSKNAAAKMTSYMQGENVQSKIGVKTIQTNILVMVPMGENSYQVRWNEEEYSIGSGSKIITPMSGVFTINLNPPKEEKDLNINPLGLYIIDFNWAKETVVPPTNNK